MAKFVLTKPYLSIGGADITDHVKEITVDTGVDQVEGTASADAMRNFLAGSLKVASIDVVLYQDFAASKTHALLNAALGVSTAVEVRPTNAAVSSTNPKYSGNALAIAYQPWAGEVGKEALAAAKFVPADGTGLVWATS